VDARAVLGYEKAASRKLDLGGREAPALAFVTSVRLRLTRSIVAWEVAVRLRVDPLGSKLRQFERLAPPKWPNDSPFRFSQGARVLRHL
jgi:hypothetical protein